MAVNKLIDIEYRTGNLKYDKVRTGVLQNKDRLTELGYRCAWTEDLDLSAELNPAELRERGYSVAWNGVLTTFDREWLPFIITIFPKSQRAKLYGVNQIYQSEFNQVRQDLNGFEEVTGIRMYLKQTSEPD